MAQTSNSRVFKRKPPVPSDLLYYDHGSENSRIRWGHRTPIAVCIAGACRGNGTPSAKAAMGVWFGEDGRYNINCSIEFLPHWACKSTDGAAIFAAQLAVETVKENFEQEACADGFVIITDSNYLFKAFSTISTKNDNWVDKRFRGAIETVHDDICDLEEAGANVRFWKVDRAHNQYAVDLANDAFDPRRRVPVQPRDHVPEEHYVMGSSLDFSEVSAVRRRAHVPEQHFVMGSSLDFSNMSLR